MNLLLLDAAELRGGATTISGARARHLLNVLQVVPEQTVRIGIVDGPCGVGTVTAVGEEMVSLSCSFDDDVPTRPAIDLLMALPRPKVLQRLWAQIAALGVGRIILTNAEKVERNYFDTHVLTPAVYGPLLLEGLQQARDTRVPLVSIHRQFRVLVEDELSLLVPEGTRIVAEPDAGRRLSTAIPTLPGARVVLAIGPEGGWNAFELGLLERHGFRRAALDGRTLRSDTACVALLAVIHEMLRAHALPR